MGMAKLNIFVSGIDDPCGLDERTWYVNIYECCGNVLRWCNRVYAVIPAPCGHLEIEVPPGCYYINAVWGFTVVGPGVYQANHFTHSAIVTASCEETACVKLFNPSAHRCGRIYVQALRDLVAQDAIAPELAGQVEEAVAAINQQLGQPVRLFELGHEDEIERLVKKQEGKQKRKK
ncbi:MAG: hypothetical protein JSW55_08625 [Chloroflexota bacterium]|nr:MAG: hypothetical protein JSW55_08625 [Chloroflexota bacterium]